MTSTLVLGPARSTRSRYAVSLLSPHPQVRLLSTHEEPATPGSLGAHEGWTVVPTAELTRGLLGSRCPVLVDDLPTWVRRIVDEHGFWADEDAAHALVLGRAEELCLALSALPFETVALSFDPTLILSGAVESPGDTDARLWAELTDHVTSRVSASATFVHEIRGGRVLDLSDAPPADPS